MKIVVLFTGLAILLAGVVPGKPALAQNTQDFSFESFSADYYLDRDGQNASTLKVDETLVADFPSYDQNHGILRAIPQTYKGHTLSLKNISVTDQNKTAYQYTSSNQNGNKVLKIGDPNSYVQGQKIYKISYQIHDVASFYSDHDEFYWDINGDQWAQNFGNVEARIHIPAQLAFSLQDRQLCYEGIFGSTSQSCTIDRSSVSGETLITALASSVRPNQTLSVVLGFKSGTFKLSQAAISDQQRQKIERVAGFVLAIVPPTLALAFMFSRWRKFGNDPKGRGIIIPEYEPPKGFDVLNSDYLLKQQLRSTAVSAAIIEKAVAGFITIYEIPKKGFFSSKDYMLQLNKTPTNLSAGEVKVFEAIFDTGLPPGSRTSLNDIKKDSSRGRQIYKDFKKAEDDLANELFEVGYFIKNPKDVKRGYMTWAGIFISAAFLLGYMVLATIPFLVGGAVGLGLTAVVLFIFSFIMPARTQAGVMAHDALLGLKDYIKLAEADRIKFLQSPEGAEKIADKEAFDPKNPAQKVKLFEKLLPYAMLFGLEKDWAKQFNDIYTTPPGWYQGGNWTAFNAGYLVGSLNGFSAASSVSFASPSSSSGSGFAGGGAGGGGGGGGGGGW